MSIDRCIRCLWSPGELQKLKMVRVFDGFNSFGFFCYMGDCVAHVPHGGIAGELSSGCVANIRDAIKIVVNNLFKNSGKAD